MMNKRIVAGLELSDVGMGCMGFSHGYGEVPEESCSIDAIREAYETGCNFFDTAESYGQQQFYPGHNEELVGKAVHPFRNQIILATKLHILDSELEAQPDLSVEERIRNHLDASLKRLQTDYVDLYYLHRINSHIPVEEVAEVMGRLKKEGKIKGWGLSQVGIETLMRAHAVEPVTAVQNLYNMVERDCEKDIFPFCLENDILVVPFSPVASGLLTGKVTPDTDFSHPDDVRKFVPQLSKENIIGNQPIVEVVERFSKKKQVTNAQIAIAWMLKKYPNVVPIEGSKNRERIQENLKASLVELSDEEFQELEAALAACEIHGHRGHQEDEGHRFLPKDFGKAAGKQN